MNLKSHRALQRLSAAPTHISPAAAAAAAASPAYPPALSAIPAPANSKGIGLSKVSPTRAHTDDGVRERRTVWDQDSVRGDEPGDSERYVVLLNPARFTPLIASLRWHK